MRVIYTNYAEDTIKDRKFSKEIIEDALKNPDEIVKGKITEKLLIKSLEINFLELYLKKTQKLI